MALFGGFATGIVVWFLTRSIPDSVSALTVVALQVVAPRMAGPLAAKQVEIGLAILASQFVGAVLVLIAYGRGMQHGRRSVDEQEPKLVRLRFITLAIAPFLWSWRMAQFLPHPPTSRGIALALAMVAFGAAIATLVDGNGFSGSQRLRIGTIGATLAVVGAVFGQLPLPPVVTVLDSLAAMLAAVYLVGQLVELASRSRLQGAGGTLLATLAGFLVGLALGRA